MEKPGEETAQSEPPTIHKTSHKTIHKELFATEKAVIDIIKQHPTITRKELAATLNFSRFIGILADYWSIVKKWKDGGLAS